MSFEDNIKKWVYFDNKNKELNDQIKIIRNNKSLLTEKIINHVDENASLQDAVVKISDGRLKFSQTKQTSPITLSFLESCLKDIIQDDENVKKIMDYIKSQRDTKIIQDIKRYYDN
tara:strand:- start:666 stop:1013 length:348 start_codon:yes stop_codon:yes gene_type:complete